MLQPTTNYACVLTKPLTVEIQDVTLPSVGREDVMIKVESTGICGSDVCQLLFSDCLNSYMNTL